MARIGDGMDTEIKAILEANRHPETFICDHCGRTKYQNQSDTQRKGWPVCHRMTMKAHKVDDDEGTGSLDHIHW